MSALKFDFIAIPLCFILLLFYSINLVAEQPCGNEIYLQYIENNPVLKSEFKAINNLIQASETTNRLNGTILEIPIAVTVLHLGEPIGTGTNISDEFILETVRGVNERWRKVTGDGVDMEVQFCLAQYDPQGNSSNGIVRINASSVPNYSQYGISYIGALGEPGADETTIKNLNNWPHNYVYNIWVVNKIAGGWGGFALFPLNGNYANDGTVIIASNMRYSSTTLAHELGHGMGLFHTFQGNGNESICPDNLFCSLQGDWVCDTPPHKKEDCVTTTCSNSPDSLLALTFKNYMSYCSGRNLFTAGQKTRSRNTIFNSSRNQLLNSNACYRPCDTIKTYLALTTCDILSTGNSSDTLKSSYGCDSIIISNTSLLPFPIANFSYTASGLEVAFSNQSLNADTYEWDFGDSIISSEINPTHQYSAPGTYIIRSVANNVCSSDTVIKTITLVTTGINLNNALKPLSIYPNPTNGTFTLDMNITDNESYYIIITNTTGQILEKQKLFAGKQHQIHLNNKIGKGIFQLQIKKENTIIGVTSITVL